MLCKLDPAINTIKQGLVARREFKIDFPKVDLERAPESTNNRRSESWF